MPFGATLTAFGDGVRWLIVGAVVSGGATYPIDTSLSVGVWFGSLDVSTAWYCRYRELALIWAPGPLSGAKLVQLPSGVGVSPVRTLSAMPVPAGDAAVQLSPFQLTVWVPSKTREVKVPEPGYGLIRSQSTLTVPASPLNRSLARGRICTAMLAVWVATSEPST